MSRFVSRQRYPFTWWAHRQRPFLVSLGLVLLLSAVITSCLSRESSPPSTDVEAVDGQLLYDLFTGVHGAQTDVHLFSAEFEALLSENRSVAQTDPNWPTLTYLLGEAHRLRGETKHARDTFRELASWGASDHPNGPYKDTWGGSGLVIVGLWRWLQILEEDGPSDSSEVGQVLEVASQLQETRLYSGMVQSRLLAALPQLEEDVAKRLAYVAWQNKRPEAVSLFLDFLAINSHPELGDPLDQKIKAEILRQEMVDPERLELFRARRLLGLVKDQEQRERVAEMLKKLWDNRQNPADVRAEAGYEWANFNRGQSDRQELVEVLTAVLKLVEDQSTAEKALYRRGMVHNRGWQDQDAKLCRDQDAKLCRDQDAKLFRDDMLELGRRFPAGRLSDDALFQLANAYFFNADMDKALPYYEDLRNLPGSHDYEDSAYYLPALGLIGRGRESDLDRAEQLLAEYLGRYPDGVFRLRCLFWQGRIAEKKDDTGKARSLFRQVIEEAPYDYYAVRAQMHLEEGVEAIGEDLTDFQSQTRLDLANAYRNSRVDTQLAHDSPYHARLQTAQRSGLYRRLLDVERSHTQRLDNIPLQQLDSKSLIPAIALLLAFRQDALAAKDSYLTADNWLRLAGLLGHEIQDWPVAIEMTSVSSSTLRQRLTTDLQKDSRYLATVYPDPAKLKTFSLEQLLARESWPIEESNSLSQSLMYAVMRHESRFYPEAISEKGAMGLFQFMLRTFRRLKKESKKEWESLKNESRDVQWRAAFEYLREPANSINLWARWVTKELKVKQRRDLAIGLMKHQGGSGNVARWHCYWKKVRSEDDIEYKIETVGYNATRNFVRGTLRDIAIVEAAGFFEGRTGR